MTSNPVGNFTYHSGVGEHSGFHRGRPQIAHDRVELRADQVDVYRTPRGDAECVLCGYGGDDRRPVDAEAMERLEIGLNARTTAGIGPGNGEGDGVSQFLLLVTGLGGIDARRALNAWKFCESCVSPCRMSGS